MASGHTGIGLISGLLDDTFDPVEHHSIAGEYPDSVYYEGLGRSAPAIVVGANDPRPAGRDTCENLRGRELGALTPKFSA